MEAEGGKKKTKKPKTLRKLKPRGCPVCSKEFTTPGNMRRHFATHSESREKPFTCKACSKAFFTACDLKWHVASVHEGGKNFVCKICSRAFSTKSHLKRHGQVHEPKTTRRTFPCEVCSRGFYERSDLKRHSLTHLGDDPKVPCGWCGKRFLLCNMRQHMMTHDSEKRFSCETCGAKFRSKRNLQRHLDAMPKDHTLISRDALSISKDDVIGGRRFQCLEKVAEQRVSHNTHISSRESIDSAKFLRGGVVAGAYDGKVQGLELAYTQASPASGEIIYPFSSFPRNVAPGARTAMIKLDLSFLAKRLTTGEYKLFHCQTTPTQFGKLMLRAYQTHVLVSPKEHWDQLESSQCVALDPRRNDVFVLDEQDEFQIAQRVKESTSGEARRTQVVLAFVGGCDLKGASYVWMDSTRLHAAPGRGFRKFYCPECDRMLASIAALKVHYLKEHRSPPPEASRLFRTRSETVQTSIQA